MANVLVLTSGNGGVGKTTSTAALGAALARCSDTVVVVDFDVGPRNLHLVMGAERRVVFDFIDVMHGTAMLSQALIRDERLDTLWVLPASQTRDKDALTADGVAKVIEEIRRGFDWVLCDSPAGIERGETHAIRHADAAIIVANPAISSGDRPAGRQDRKGRKRRAGREIPVDYPLRPSACRRRRDAEHRGRARDSRHPSTWGVPESQEMLRASNLGAPVPLCNPASAPARAYRAAARRFKGEDVPIMVSREAKQLFGGLFRRRAA
jgi:septum site-determining protein MinD